MWESGAVHRVPNIAGAEILHRSMWITGGFFSTLILEWISVGFHTLSHPLSTSSPKKLMVLPMFSVNFTCCCLQCTDINQSHDQKSLVLGNKFCLILQAHPAFWSSVCTGLTLLMRWKQFHILWSFFNKNKVRKINEGTGASLSAPLLLSTSAL